MKKALLGILALIGAGVFYVGPQFGADCRADISKSAHAKIETCGLSSAEKRALKADEIAAKDFKQTFVRYGVSVQIISVEKMDGGVQVFARAWKDGEQLGFGPDGSVDVERFRIFNPPILVDDPKGNIVRTSEVSPVTGKAAVRKMREDPAEALRQELAHTISLVGKTGTAITAGKVGNTTSTFYPDANTETTSVDGSVHQTGSTNWSTVRNNTAGNVARPSNTTIYVQSGKEGANFAIERTFLLYDTSAIPDTDTISSATLSINYDGTKINDDNDGNDYINVYTSTPASNTDLVVGDYDQVGTTAQSDAPIDITGIGSAGYKDFALNAAGLASVSKTSVSKFSIRMGQDAIDHAYVGSNDTNNYIQHTAADTTGTASDPKLVVVHAGAAAVEAPKQDIIFFE